MPDPVFLTHNIAVPASSRGSGSKFSPTSELMWTCSRQTFVEKMSVKFQNNVNSLASVSICDLIEYIVTRHIFFLRATGKTR